jgi:hypothetical protein
MRTTKVGAVLASLAITAGTATLLAAGPAQANTTTTVQLTFTDPNSGQQYTGWRAPYGTDLGTLTSQVTTDGVTPVPVGAADLQQKLPGKDWKVARQDLDVSDGIDFGSYGSKARGNVKYRVHYLGGTDATTMTTYDASYSNAVSVITLWKIKDTSACPMGHHCHISGRLVPKAKHHKILVQVKHGGWKKYRVLHTNRKSKYRVGVTGSRKGTKYRIIIAGTKKIAATEKRYIVTLVPARNARAASLSLR